mmetsp:Transcript_32192/g.96116  ORF Transcript_32192/g.96116 Transcript_32192/m.96116 type:complete len:202 (+) Transcript_32192:314-919(+)
MVALGKDEDVIIGAVPHGHEKHAENVDAVEYARVECEVVEQHSQQAHRAMRCHVHRVPLVLGRPAQNELGIGRVLVLGLELEHCRVAPLRDLLVVHHEDPDVVGGGPRRPHRERRQRQRRKPGGRKLPLLLLAQLVKPRHHVPCVPTHEPGDDRRRQVLEQRGHLVDAVQHKRVARRDRRRRQHARHEREDQLVDGRVLWE